MGDNLYETYEKANEEAKRMLASPTPADRMPVLVPCLDEEIGVTFTAEVAKSKTFPDGRVVCIHDFRYPKKPDGLPLDDTKEACKLWRWEVYQAVLKRVVGKPLSRYMRADYQLKMKVDEDKQAKK